MAEEVLEQQIAISDAEAVAMPEPPTEGGIRLRYNIPYTVMPYCYARHEDTFGGCMMYLFRSQPLKDPSGWHLSPSTSERVEIEKRMQLRRNAIGDNQ